MSSEEISSVGDENRRFGRIVLNSLAQLGDFDWAKGGADTPDNEQGQLPCAEDSDSSKALKGDKGLEQDVARANKNDACKRSLSPSKPSKENRQAVPPLLFGKDGLIPDQKRAAWLRGLAQKCYDPTPGAYNDAWGSSYRYLGRYLKYTYERLREAKRIALFQGDRNPIKYKNPDTMQMGPCKYMAFNTGLQESRADNDIFACFERGPGKDDRWEPDGFHIVGPTDTPQDLKWTNILSRRKISRADFFEDANSSEVRYNGQGVEKPARFFEHVFLDNLARLPEAWVIAQLDSLTSVGHCEKGLARMCFREAVDSEMARKKIPGVSIGLDCTAAREAQREIASRAARACAEQGMESEAVSEEIVVSALGETLKRVSYKPVPYAYVWLELMRFVLGVAGSDEIKMRISSALTDAIDESVSRGRNDPCAIDVSYYPDASGAKTTAMFPIWIPVQANSACAGGPCNLVLAADPVVGAKTTYTARTVFTVEQAYWNARLVRRPETGWLSEVGRRECFLVRVGEPVGTIEVDKDGNPIVPATADAWLDIEGRPVQLNDDCLIGRGWDANGVDGVDRFLDFPQLSRKQGRFEKVNRGWSFVRDVGSTNTTTVLKVCSGSECTLEKGERIDLDDGDQIILAPGMYAITFRQR